MRAATTTKAPTKKPLIINPDQQARKSLRDANHFVIQVDLKNNSDVSDVFVILSASTFSKHADVLHQVIEHANKLRILFVKWDGSAKEKDQNVNALLDKLSEAPWNKQQQKIFVFEKWNEVDRVLHAWCDGVQDRTIASAWVDGDTLIVKSCSLKKYQIKFSESRQLSKIAPEDRNQFAISDLGDHLYWGKKYDLHVDIIDVIRYIKEPKYQKLRDVADIARNKGYGEAIAEVRQAHGLTQAEIYEKTGLTDRQLRRIEREGYPLSTQAAEKLAKAHGMQFTEYLNAVSKKLHTFPQFHNRTEKKA